MFKTFARSFFPVAVAIATLALVPTAGAAPTNDAFADASAISSLPFTDTAAIDTATMEPGEPLPPCAYGSPNAQTVWYAVTPSSSGMLRISDSATFYYQFLGAYRADGAGLTGLTNVGCASWAYGTSQTTFNVDAGKTYYIQAGSNFPSSGSIGISVELIQAPANDDFAGATAVTSVPYSSTADTTAASVESGEPTPSCGYGGSASTVWYAFTPTISGSYSASTSGGFGTQTAVYTGSSLTSLSQIRCQAFSSLLTFHANAGTTYYLQVGGLFGSRGPITLSFDVAPNPVAGFYSSPSDPSRYDTIQFGDQSYDPGQVGVTAWSWSFGDGGTSTAQWPTHVYASDGDYSVKLTVTTGDGRTASVTRIIQVRTHDVAIAKLSVPSTAHVGQTRTITVAIADKNYPESVQVQLLISGPGGWTVVGTSSQSVPIRSGGRTTDFTFNYTFTPTDGTLGKVSFRAVASIVDARDALPGDNDVTGLPTTVS
jgi:PKD repeat protein